MLIQPHIPRHRAPDGLLADGWLRRERGLLLPPRSPVAVPCQAAISAVGGPAQIVVAAGTQTIDQSIDATGADYLWVYATAYDSSFNGRANPSAITYGGTGMVALYVSSGGDQGTNGVVLYGIHAPAQGGADLEITFPATITYGPVIIYGMLSGVVQSATASDVRRTVVVDNTAQTSISLALGAGQGLAAGDYILYFGDDWEDVSHTPSGVCIEDLETTQVNFRCAVAGHFLATGASHTGGWTGGSDFCGIACAMIPAPAGAIGAALARRRSSLICR